MLPADLEMRSAVAGKARVHELAKELGVESKTVLAKLKEMGEFVKSASSTVEAPVARRLRGAFVAAIGGAAGRAAPAPAAPAAPTAARRRAQRAAGQAGAAPSGAGRRRPAPAEGARSRVRRARPARSPSRRARTTSRWRPPRRAPPR